MPLNSKPKGRQPCLVAQATSSTVEKEEQAVNQQSKSFGCRTFEDGGSRSRCSASQSTHGDAMVAQTASLAQHCRSCCHAEDLRHVLQDFSLLTVNGCRCGPQRALLRLHCHTLRPSLNSGFLGTQPVCQAPGTSFGVEADCLRPCAKGSGSSPRFETLGNLPCRTILTKRVTFCRP